MIILKHLKEYSQFDLEDYFIENNKELWISILDEIEKKYDISFEEITDINELFDKMYKNNSMGEVAKDLLMYIQKYLKSAGYTIEDTKFLHAGESFNRYIYFKGKKHSSSGNQFHIGEIEEYEIGIEYDKSRREINMYLLFVNNGFDEEINLEFLLNFYKKFPMI